MWVEHHKVSIWLVSPGSSLMTKEISLNQNRLRGEYPASLELISSKKSPSYFALSKSFFHCSPPKPFPTCPGNPLTMGILGLFKDMQIFPCLVWNLFLPSTSLTQPSHERQLLQQHVPQEKGGGYYSTGPCPINSSFRLVLFYLWGQKQTNKTLTCDYISFFYPLLSSCLLSFKNIPTIWLSSSNSPLSDKYCPA